MANKTILVVDDEKDCIVFLETILENEGYEVVSAMDGVSGIEKAESEKPDLIFLDVQMPKKDGLHTFYELRKEEASTQEIPVIMLTGIKEKTGIGFGKQEMKEYFGKAPEGYLEKPIEPEKVVEALNKVFND